jgi:hypothetical protein
MHPTKARSILAFAMFRAAAFPCLTAAIPFQTAVLSHHFTLFPPLRFAQNL